MALRTPGGDLLLSCGCGGNFSQILNQFSLKYPLLGWTDNQNPRPTVLQLIYAHNVVKSLTSQASVSYMHVVMSMNHI